MKQLLIVVGLFALSLNAYALKPCGELKNEIADKLDAKGVKNYSLTIVANADVGDQKVVGSCDGGTNKIIYSRDTAPVAAPVETSTETEAPAKVQ
jgi:Protein of unknown function (DUF1161)